MEPTTDTVAQSIQSVLAACGVQHLDWLESISARDIELRAQENALGEFPGQEARLPWRAPLPTVPVLILDIASEAAAGSVARWLSNYYPAGHEVRFIINPGRPNMHTGMAPLSELPCSGMPNAALYVPPLSEVENVRTFTGLMNLTRTLRAPGGCPWDREQTHATLKPHLIEEAYEVVDALDRGDPAEICEELGDLLFQVAIHAQVASEAGTFTIEDVIGGIVTKLVGRHPHVFGDMSLTTSDEVLGAWESFKQREKPKRLSALESIPRGMPALPQSNLIQKRAAGVGFEWPDTGAVIDKVEEELEELRNEIERGASKDLQREEFGDILFAAVSIARHLRIDPEEALRLANRKFAARFQYVESRASADGVKLKDLSPERLDGYWNEAKALGGSSQGDDEPA